MDSRPNLIESVIPAKAGIQCSVGASESHPGILPPRPTFFRLNDAPLGGLERKVADMQARDIAWTPDSKALAVSAEVDGNIRVVRVLRALAADSTSISLLSLSLV